MKPERFVQEDRIDVIATQKLPSPKGPYSQAVRAGDFLFISGIVGIEPRSGAIAQGDICIQSAQVMDNLKILLEEAGGSLADIVKTTVFLADMNDYNDMNAVYAKYFPKNHPARSTIEAKPPADFVIELEAIAYLPR